MYLLERCICIYVGSLLNVWVIHFIYERVRGYHCPRLRVNVFVAV